MWMAHMQHKLKRERERLIQINNKQNLPLSELNEILKDILSSLEFNGSDC